jgi:drug/metabolite transporter (DMT)-like permease
VKTKDLIELLLLAAMWGASFLFMRVAAPAFGPAALILLRVAIATACLLPILLARGEGPMLLKAWLPLTVVGLLNSALPFCLFAYATLSLSAGFTAVLNATSPLWGAVVAYVWLKMPLPRWRVIGLFIGFAGVVLLVWGKVSFKPGGDGFALVAAIGATFAYGIAANYTKEKLVKVTPFAVATGSQLTATIMLLPIAIPLWPATTPPLGAWGAVAALGIVCTAMAYILYYRLIAHLGASKAIAVTFLIPLFAILWGGMFLGEAFTPSMMLGGAVILFGTSLALGLWAPRRLAAA